MLSRQTKPKPQFAYHPLDDATITLFPTDGAPKQFILKAVPFTSPPEAVACNGKVRASIIAHYDADGDGYATANQLAVYVNGKRTERYSIVYPGRKTKKRFARY